MYTASTLWLAACKDFSRLCAVDVKLIMPRSPYIGALSVDSCCLSVCLSVRLSVPVPDPKSRIEGHRKLKIGRKEAHDTGDS